MKLLPVPALILPFMWAAVQENFIYSDNYYIYGTNYCI
jgi:hypothetical protein